MVNLLVSQVIKRKLLREVTMTPQYDKQADKHGCSSRYHFLHATTSGSFLTNTHVRTHTQARTAGLLLCSCGTSELKQCKQRDVVCGCYEAVWEFGGIAPFVV